MTFENISFTFPTNIANRGSAADNMMIFSTILPESSLSFDPEDQGNGTLTITDLTPMQVIKNVDMVFEIKLNNTITSNISNISWTLDTGEDTKSSIYNFNLKSAEQIFFYLTHNYSSSGNFSVIFSAFNNKFLETEIFQLAIS